MAAACDHQNANHVAQDDTVLRAIGMLRAEGVVFTVPRRGTYVSKDTT